jgi:uncharacterized membrane protein
VGASLRKYLVAGLLVWLPLAITVWVLAQVLDVVNGVFGSMLAALALIMPTSLREGLLELRHVPGLGSSSWPAACWSRASSSPTSSASGC